MTDQQAKATDQETEHDPAQQDYQAALTFLENEEYSQAAHALHNALLGYEEEGKEEGIANASFRMGEVCAAQQEHERALQYWDKTEEICRRNDDLMSLMAIRKKRVISLRALKKIDAAVAIYLDMLDIYQSMNNPASSVETLTALGETYEEANLLDKASDAYTTAAGIHRHYGHSKEEEILRQRAAALSAGK